MIFGDLVGRRFGKLTVTERHGRKFDCLCDCGGAITLTRGQLARKRSCGCRAVNVGQRFGILTVVRLVGGKAHCKCNCGKPAIVDRRDLRRGHTKSCGCIKKLPRPKQPMKLRRIYRKMYPGYGMDWAAFERWAMAAGWQFGKRVVTIGSKHQIEPGNLRVV